MPQVGLVIAHAKALRRERRDQRLGQPLIPVRIKDADLPGARGATAQARGEGVHRADHPIRPGTRDIGQRGVVGAV